MWEEGHSNWLLNIFPNEILKIYCDDVSKGKKEDDGRIYNEIFRDHIPLAELKAFGFWDGIKNKTE